MTYQSAYILIIIQKKAEWNMLEESKLSVANALKLPKDVVMGEMLISFVGRHSVVIENYRSIILYTDSLVKLQGRNCRVNLSGARLTIEYYTKDEMKISGHIKTVEFE